MEFKIVFSEGAKITCTELLDFPIKVEFWNDERNYLENSIVINSPGSFATPKKYFIPWRVKVFKNDEKIHEEKMELNGKNVFIHIDSPSIGDTLAWVSQAVRFWERYDFNLTVFTDFYFMFQEVYPEIKWVHSKHNDIDPYARYRISYWLSPQRFYFNPIDPRTSPLAKVASNILGIDYIEKRPKVKELREFKNPLEGEKYVCISTTSTAGAKEWNFTGGWQKIVDYLKEIGYKVIVIQKEPTNLEGVVDMTGDFFILERAEILRKSDFFVGLPSGISWLSWSVGIPVVMISGFSSHFAEFEGDCYRVFSSGSCKPCWNDQQFIFDKSDWYWCPRNKGTENQFKCTKDITSKMVIEKIDLLIKEKNTKRYDKTKEKTSSKEL